MKDNWAFVAILVGIAIVSYVIYKSREGFEVAFVDKTNDAKTDRTRVSSYEQTTNNFKPTNPAPQVPPGVETPYRVNAWNSYVPF
jgi:hypothetical protein